MTTLTNLPIGSSVSFDVYPTPILGTAFRYAKVLAHLDADTARFWIDPEALHTEVYPYLPDGVPDDATGYSYVKLKLTNGTVTVVGVPWIKSETIQVTSETTIVITVDQVGPEDRDNIVKALSANGYKTAKVELK